MISTLPPTSSRSKIEPEMSKAKRRSHGTEIKLVDLMDDVSLPDEKKLREYLARHLPSPPGWRVRVNGEECTSADIAGKKIEISEKIRGFGKVNGFYIIAESTAAASIRAWPYG